MEMTMRRFGRAFFHDREEAGRLLGEALRRVGRLEAPIVLALPRGGVPVGFEVARALDAPLDVLVVRKLGYPGQEELAIGAIASGGVRVLNQGLLDASGVPQEVVERIARRERAELERRERAYRGDAPLPRLGGRSVILVDDGLATGSTMSAAVAAVRQLGPAEVIVAVPVAPVETVSRLDREADLVICLVTPRPFLAIGPCYATFPQVGDEEVVELLARAAHLARGEWKSGRERARGT
jgi:predicted phosphoribosyltransferase